MPRAKDKEVIVLDYFAQAELSAAELVLKLAANVVKGRRGLRLAPTPRDTVGAAAAPKTRARKGKPQDVPLPGVQSEVG